MDRHDAVSDVISDTRELVKQAAHAKRGTITVSPEVADLLGSVAPPDAAVPADDGTAAELAALEEQVSTCTLCRLSETRTQTVFGDGPPHADLVFVGEAPGADEDAQGKPFVGRAGQLLTDIIEKGMGRQRRDVYICNVIKCRPPGNRDPRPDEKGLCEPYRSEDLRSVAS